MILPKITKSQLSTLTSQGYVGHVCSHTSCTNEVDPRRFKAANNYKSQDLKRFKEVLCCKCVSSGKDVTPVGGVTLIRGKNDYSSVQLVPLDFARKVHKSSDRAGTGVSRGMKNGVN